MPIDDDSKNVRLSLNGMTKDYNLYLLDKYGMALASSENVGVSGSNEEIIFKNLATDNYYVKIVGNPRGRASLRIQSYGDSQAKPLPEIFKEIVHTIDSDVVNYNQRWHMGRSTERMTFKIRFSDELNNFKISLTEIMSGSASFSLYDSSFNEVKGGIKDSSIDFHTYYYSLTSGDYYIHVVGAPLTSYKLIKSPVSEFSVPETLIAGTISGVDVPKRTSTQEGNKEIFWKLPVDQNSNTVRLTLYGMLSDLRLELYNSVGKVIGASDDLGVRGSIEEIVLRGLKTGDYFIRIACTPSKNCERITTYLRLQSSGSNDFNPVVAIDNTISGDDVAKRTGSLENDSYYWKMPVTRNNYNARITLYGMLADLKLEIFDSSGNILDSSDNLGVRGAIEEVILEGLNKGDYYIKISCGASATCAKMTTYLRLQSY